jgi:hypothetical protein
MTAMETVKIGARAEVANAVAELQGLAGAFAQSLALRQSVVNFQVVYLAGAASPWRLVETTRSVSGRRRQMLCFDALDEIRSAVDERLAWQRADEKFVATHMTTPGGFPGYTSDWVHTRDFDAVFGPAREAMREQHCRTVAKNSVALP